MDEMRRLLTEACLAAQGVSVSTFHKKSHLRRFMLSQNRWTFRHDIELASVYWSRFVVPEKGSLNRVATGRGIEPSLMQRWLRDCVENHPSCAKENSVWPTRLIYVGSSNSQSLRLLEAETEMIELANGHGYATLSHCWGQPIPEEKDRFCTTNENYRHRLQGFSLNELPKTFQHAIRVTRCLGLSLLWVDALCINQTNSEAPDSDWNKEARRMQDVFSSALVTICATSATNWAQGFCGSIPSRSLSKELFQHVKSSLWRAKRSLGHRAVEKFKTLEDNDFKRKVDASPLSRRAWVLQESVLSRRLIHFTEDSTYWQCGKHVRSDDFKELQW